MARCLVLGANGFIGSHLVDVLADRGHHVRCFDRYKSNSLAFYNHSHHKIEVFRGDFLSRASLETALKDIEYVFHFISTTNPMTAENDPLIDIETNIKMSVELFKFCSQKKVKKVIFASTGGAIYGESLSNIPVNEETFPKPISPYAIGKLTIENYLRYFKAKHNLHYSVLRISNPYGPRQNILSGQGVVSIFLDKLKNNNPLIVYGDGTMIRDYIYVEDVANMIAGSFQKQTDDSVYNLGSGKGYTINEIISAINKATGIDTNSKNIPTPATFVHSIVLDTSKFTEDFNLTPSTSLDVGIAKTWKSIK